MVSEMESVKNVTNNPINNAAYLANPPSAQPVHSPQSVGMEFVRQYYTMLNRAPHLLFRFYSDDSTFVHGCLEPQPNPNQFVRGQKQINAKILALNFTNVHTKIRQVDSMETIGNGVVIQVIGDISNNGQPLRRFLQTFVLTPQSPNKYYVRNDIFRYQDESEENDESIEKNDIETKIENNIEADAMDSVETNEKDYYQQNGNMTEPISDHISSVEENLNKPNESAPEHIQENSMDFSSTSVAEESDAKGEQIGNDDEVDEAEVESVSDSASNANHLSSDGPKTYASMLSKSFQGGGSPNLNSSKPQVNVTVVNFTSETSVASITEFPAVSSTINNNKAAVLPPQRERYIKKTGFNKRNESKESAKNEEENIVEPPKEGGDDQLNSASKGKIFPDDHQLFIGNLLPNFNEEDLRTIFGPFGKILEIRINRPNHKPNTNKANRNYGFITFENADVVDQIIAQKPIYHGNHRYNVEKKQGKSNNYDRNRPNNQNNISPRNGTQPNPVPNPSVRYMQPMNNAVAAGQANLGPRTRPGQNYNSANNIGNRNFVSGQNYNNKNYSQQQPQQQGRQ